MPNWESFGRHRYYRETDLAFFEHHGGVSLEEIQFVFQVSDEIRASQGYILVVFDMRDGSGMSQQARRYCGERTRTNQLDSATVIVGASLAIRTVTLLVQNAGRLFGQQPPPIHFCDTVPEALQMLAGHRKRFLAARVANHPLTG